MSEVTDASDSPEAPVPRPKVTVLVTTYNHERYLRGALESVLRQKSEVPFDVLVADDASTDGTSRVAMAFRDRYPGTVRVMRPSKNMGPNAMFVAATAEVRGDYVALLDGDDAWIGTDKLERQAAFLDANPGVSGCFHDATVVYEDGSCAPRPALAELRQPVLNLADLVVRNIVPSVTLMYRHVDAAALREWFEAVAGDAWDRIIGVDWLTLLLLAQQGPLVRLDGLAATYRVHGGGVWSSPGRLAQLGDERMVYRRIGGLLPRTMQTALTTGLVRNAVEAAVEEAGLPHDLPVAVAGPTLPTPWYLNGRSVVELAPTDTGAAHELDALRTGITTVPRDAEQHFRSLPSLPASHEVAGYLVVAQPGDMEGHRPGLRTYADALPCLSIDGNVAVYELPMDAPPRRTVAEVRMARRPTSGLVGANIELPLASTDVDRTMRLVGWALPGVAPARRAVVVNAACGRVLAAAPLDVTRPDLAAAYPDVPHAVTSGFLVDVVLGDGVGGLVMDVAVDLADGSRAKIGTVVLTRPMANRGTTHPPAPTHLGGS